MIMKPSVQFQIGKNGITPEAISAMRGLFERYKQIRIKLLPSSGRSNSNIKQMAEEIALKIEMPCYIKIIGFTIILLRKGLGHDRKPKKQGL